MTGDKFLASYITILEWNNYMLSVLCPELFCKKCPYTCSTFLPLTWNHVEGSDVISLIFSALHLLRISLLCLQLR